MDRRPVLVSLPDETHAPDDSHRQIERRLDAEDAARALEVLRPDQRRFLELSLIEGLSHAEIAAQTGTPLGTVKSGIRRGLAAAQKALGDSRGSA